MDHDDSLNSVPDNNTEEDDFADFESFSNQTSFKTDPPNVIESSCENRPGSIPIIDDQVNEIDDDVHVKTDDQNCGSSNGALIDSGVYSSNISPVQQCDNSSVYRDCMEDFGGNSTVVDSVNQQESIIGTEDSCDAHLNIPSDEKNPQVVFLDDHKANETENSVQTSVPELNSSQTNIPIDDIPLNLKKDVVNLDDPDGEFKEIQSDLSATIERDSDNESESLETESGNETVCKESVNNNSQEPHCCQSQLQSDLNIDSDFQTHTTEPLNTNHEPDGVNCAPDLMEPESISTENLCDIVPSTINERLNGESAELNTTLEVDSATADSLKTDSVNPRCSLSGHSCNSNSSVDTETSIEDLTKTILNSADDKTSNTETDAEIADSHKVNDLTAKAEAYATSVSQTSNLEENKNTDNSGDMNETLHSNENKLTNDQDEFSDIKYSNVDCDVRSDENEDFGEFNTSSSFKDTCDKNTGSTNSGNDDDDDDFGDFGEFGDFSQNIGQDSEIVDSKADTDDNGDFGGFKADFDQSVNKDDFDGFNATFETDNEKTGEPSDDWAAFSGPQIVNNTDTQNDDEDDDEWSGFADDDTETVSQQISHNNAVHENAASLPVGQLSKMVCSFFL